MTKSSDRVPNPGFPETNIRDNIKGADKTA